jgi:hypothetical protein
VCLLRWRERARPALLAIGEKGENSGAGGKTGVIIDARGGDIGRVMGECGVGVMFRGVAWFEAAGDGDASGEEFRGDGDRSMASEL